MILTFSKMNDNIIVLQLHKLPHCPRSSYLVVDEIDARCEISAGDRYFSFFCLYLFDLLPCGSGDSDLGFAFRSIRGLYDECIADWIGIDDDARSGCDVMHGEIVHLLI